MPKPQCSLTSAAGTGGPSPGWTGRAVRNTRLGDVRLGPPSLYCRALMGALTVVLSWQESGGMADSSNRERRKDIDYCIAVVLDPASSESARNEASRVVMSIIERVAQKVAWRFNPWVARELSDTAVAHVYGVLDKYCPCEGKFETWVFQVLYNKARDIWRRRARQRTIFFSELLGLLSEESQDEGDDSEVSVEELGPVVYPPTPWPEIEDEFEVLFRQRREAMDRLAASDTGRSRVNRKAVLWIRLRLGQAHSLQKAPFAIFQEHAREPWIQDGGLGGIVAVCIPWQASEAHWSFRPDWPTIGELWKELASRLDAKPEAPDDATFCQLVSDLAGQDLSPGQWQQWCRRAKRWARDVLGSDLWQETFGNLMPDKSPRKRPGNEGSQ